MKQPLTPEKYLDFLAARPVRTDVRWIPHSNRIVFCMRGEDNETWIECMEVDSGQRERLTKGTRPLPSADGKHLAYLADEGGKQRLQIRPLIAGEDHSLPLPPDRSEADYIAFAWSYDSRKMAYVVESPTLSTEETESKPVCIPSGKWEAWAAADVWVLTLQTGDWHKLPHCTDVYWGRSLTWLADGKRLCFQADEAVRAVCIETGEVRTLLDAMYRDNTPLSPSPDGLSIACDGMLPPHRVWLCPQLGVFPARGGAMRLLTQEIYVTSNESPASPPLWSPDGSRLYFAFIRGAFRQLGVVTLEGTLRQLTNAPRNVLQFALSSDGRRLVWAAQDACGRESIRIADADGAGERVLVNLTPQIDDFEFGSVEEVRWSSRDGLQIAGIQVLPAGPTPTGGHPLLVCLHGGAAGGIGPSGPGTLLQASPLEWHLWAAQGFAVFVPDYRGSGAFGWQPVQQARDRKELFDRDSEDILSGVEALIARGVAGPGRMVLFGHSYGAVLVQWILGHTDRFRAAIAHEGFSDWHLWYAHASHEDYAWMFHGKPWETPEIWAHNSPLTYAPHIRTPLLFIHGEHGIPVLFSRIMQDILHAQGVETRLLYYRGEGHSVQQRNRASLWNQVADRIKIHLDNPSDLEGDDQAR